MKTMKISILVILFCLSINASDNKYNEAMKSGIELLNSGSGVENYQNCANQFERIAKAEKTKWLPYYYASYSYLLMCYDQHDSTKTDAILDKAQELLDIAFKINPEESELHVLQAFLYPARIIVDPMARGMIYMEKFNYSIGKAKSANPENPRLYFLSGIMKLNLPPSIGGGPDVAKSIFITADQKFKNFQPQNDLMPVWGEEANLKEMEKLGI